MDNNKTKDTEFVITCPHCNDYIIIEKINCAIFRHGVIISNNTQINPHASRDECNMFITNKLIYGCGMPYKIVCVGGEYKAIICDYI